MNASWVPPWWVPGVVGVRLKDVSFLEDLKHTLRVNFMGGTNAPKMAKYVGYNDLTAGKRGMNADYLHMGADAFDPIYLTTEDYALEVGLTNTYKMYDNFTRHAGRRLHRHVAGRQPQHLGQERHVRLLWQQGRHPTTPGT